VGKKNRAINDCQNTVCILKCFPRREVWAMGNRPSPGLMGGPRRAGVRGATGTKCAGRGSAGQQSLSSPHTRAEPTTHNRLEISKPLIAAHSLFVVVAVVRYLSSSNCKDR
jgi:hypothetical protein